MNRALALATVLTGLTFLIGTSQSEAAGKKVPKGMKWTQEECHALLGPLLDPDLKAINPVVRQVSAQVHAAGYFGPETNDLYQVFDCQLTSESTASMYIVPKRFDPSVNDYVVIPTREGYLAYRPQVTISRHKIVDINWGEARPAYTPHEYLIPAPQTESDIRCGVGTWTGHRCRGTRLRPW